MKAYAVLTWTASARLPLVHQLGSERDDPPLRRLPPPGRGQVHHPLTTRAVRHRTNRYSEKNTTKLEPHRMKAQP